VARVVSFLGWATVGLGFVGIPIFHVVTESGRNARSTELLGLFLQVAAICALGLVLVLFGHVARAVVDIAESKRA
jgi:hypothetical protein